MPNTGRLLRGLVGACLTSTSMVLTTRRTSVLGSRSEPSVDRVRVVRWGLQVHPCEWKVRLSWNFAALSLYLYFNSTSTITTCSHRSQGSLSGARATPWDARPYPSDPQSGRTSPPSPSEPSTWQSLGFGRAGRSSKDRLRHGIQCKTLYWIVSRQIYKYIYKYTSLACAVYHLLLRHTLSMTVMNINENKGSPCFFSFFFPALLRASSCCLVKDILHSAFPFLLCYMMLYSVCSYLLYFVFFLDALLPLQTMVRIRD